MAQMCKTHNLGSRARRMHLRLGVMAAGVALVSGFALVQLGLARQLGWLLALPLALSSYWLLAGVFGLCALGGFRGRRHADYGPESVADPMVRRVLRVRGSFLVVASIALAILSAALFVTSAA